MFVKRLLQKAVVDQPVPAGNLKQSHLSPRLAVHHGIFHSASLVAYEPVQRLLAVASTEGRIKILGAPGNEVLLQSKSQLACKFLEFMNNQGLLVQVNTKNDIEIWDYEKKESVYWEPWMGDITSFYVIQGSPFILVGEHSGVVVVLQYVEGEKLLKRMDYGIPAHITLGGLVRAGDSDAPCVVATLVQPDVLYSRLVMAYGNGLIVLWGLFEHQVIAVRGGTDYQRLELSNFANSLKGRAIAAHPDVTHDDEEEKEICCMCWVCPVGSALAVGYTNGEILLWSFPTIIKAKGLVTMELVEGPAFSGEPIKTLDLAPGKAKMPVVGLNWSASCNISRGVGGRLYVFGGGEVGRPEVLMVISLDSSNLGEGDVKLLQWDLSLEGPFADMALLPPWPVGDLSSSPAAALVLLMTPGLLHIYDELSVDTYFGALAEGTPSPPLPQPVPLQLDVTETNVTCAKLVLVSNDGVAAKSLIQMPPASKSSVPSTLVAGTKWPLSGGKSVKKCASSEDLADRSIYLTGHEDGLVKFWDASSPSYKLICTVQSQSKLDADCPISKLDFCPSSGFLVVGNERGLVCVYKLRTASSEINRHMISDGGSNTQDDAVAEELLLSGEIFGSFLKLKLQVAIRAVALASGLFRLAVGDESGKVAVIDLKSNTTIFLENCFSNHPSSILSLAFSRETESRSVPPNPTSSSKPKRQQESGGPIPILYVARKDASMAAFDARTGAVLGPGAFQPKNPSTSVSLHLLDADGDSVSLPIVAPNELRQTEMSDSGSVEDESAGSEEASPLTSSGHSEAQYLLLSCTDSLRLYATSAVIQVFSKSLLRQSAYSAAGIHNAMLVGLRVSLRKIKLERTCCWTSVFQRGIKESGLIVLYTTGDIEIRSLPDLEILTTTSLSTCLKWKIELKVPVLKSLGCNSIGQLVLIDHHREVIQISCLEEDITRKHISQPQLFDRDLALADKHASAARNIIKKKSSIPGMEGLLKGVVGGVIKELKNALDPEVQHVHLASELPKLFSTRPFTIASQHSNRPKTGVEISSSDNLDIDDIDVDDTESGPLTPGSSSGGGFGGKLMRSFKGKEKSGHDSPETDRMKLFDGKDDGRAATQRTADDIRAKYGHPRKSQEVSSVMEMARNKLMERGEKLQGIENRTAELEDNAENFASMAEELAKRMAAKKWWEL